MIVRLLFVHTDEKNSNASVGTEALHYFGKDMELNNKAYLWKALIIREKKQVSNWYFSSFYRLAQLKNSLFYMGHVLSYCF